MQMSHTNWGVRQKGAQEATKKQSPNEIGPTKVQSQPKRVDSRWET